MNTMSWLNTAFDKDGRQWAWDSVSLGMFKECPYKYYLGMIQGWIPKRSAIALDFGIAYQACLETFEKAPGEHEDKVWAMVRRAFDFRECLSLSEDNRRTFRTLLRATIWYTEEHKTDAAKTVKLANGMPAIELSFQFHMGQNLLCGHLDRIVEWEGSTWVVDNKTTHSQLNSQYFARYIPDNQMSLYTVAGMVVWAQPISGILIDACELLVGFNRFARGVVTRTPTQNQEWLDDVEFWLELAKKCHIEKHWPQNDKACFLCHFKEICSKDPAVRQVFLEADYIRRVWDPLIPRK